MDIWPFSYAVRYSAKAQHPQVQVSHEDGVMVVIPKFARTTFDVQALLQERLQWILHQVQRLGIQVQSRDQLPTRIQLPCAFVERELIYQPLASRSIRLRDTGDDLILQGNVTDPARVAVALKKWIKTNVESALRARLQLFEQQTQVYSKALNFAWQKRRWGSCSGTGEISLNLKLAFLPLEYIDYIICHELAHIRHMAHNRAFWNLLQRWQPQALRLDAELQQVANLIPVLFH